MSLEITWDTESTVLLPTGGEAIRSSSEVLELDIIETDAYRIAAKLSTHAVERGIDVTDHTEPEPDRVTVQAAISARPMALNMVIGSEPKMVTEKGRTFLAITPPENTNRKGDAFEELRNLVRNGTLVNVEGPIRPLENYQIESVSAPRKLEDAGLLATEIVFVEHRTAEVQEVNAPSPRVERGRGANDQGRNNSSGDNDENAANAPGQRSSALTALGSGISGLLGTGSSGATQ